jgi:hypothetical protein
MQPSNGNRQGIQQRRTVALLHQHVLDGSAGKCIKSERSAFRPASTSLQQTHTKARLNFKLRPESHKLLVSLPFINHNVHTSPLYSSRSNGSRLPHTPVISEWHTRPRHDPQSIHSPRLSWWTDLSPMGMVSTIGERRKTTHSRIRGDGEERPESGRQAGEGQG